MGAEEIEVPAGILVDHMSPHARAVRTLRCLRSKDSRITHASEIEYAALLHIEHGTAVCYGDIV